ncbi:hypothetical protein HHI36_002263 [Cryptolaemus montrouzieri]|uniref:Uncharacterized protein n=1 Tax=Cryptolaemus montrouzieri TaxID=559131 RepID=A0ABD2PAF3_9CUCU
MNNKDDTLFGTQESDTPAVVEDGQVGRPSPSTCYRVAHQGSSDASIATGTPYRHISIRRRRSVTSAWNEPNPLRRRAYKAEEDCYASLRGGGHRDNEAAKSGSCRQGNQEPLLTMADEQENVQWVWKALENKETFKMRKAGTDRERVNLHVREIESITTKKEAKEAIKK